ncbi:signal-regulatory protein beta-2-like [Eleginops maclovinus]|uniref:signal-regulatory protein beta-2-like n=1 Tax=Eleginops maclovinus TaxID=56733 RepID=UPI00308032F4
MTSHVITLYFTFLILWKPAQMTDMKISSSVRQEDGFLSVKTGDKLTLLCFYENNVESRYYWYKQTLGQKPRLISTYYKYESNGKFQDEFKNPRFALDTGKGQNNLKITDVQISDSATYYCASSHAYWFKFREGTTVNVKGSGLKIPASVDQSVSESMQPGGSVTQNCTVHTGGCDGNHSVYWFKHSEDTLPGLIYTHGGRQCERKPNTQTHTCDYNLQMESLNPSHAGTYYCAVASCGHILFGTKLDYEDKEDSLILVYSLSGALAFTSIVNVLLVFLLCMMNKKNGCECTESHARFPSPFSTNVEADQNEATIHYSTVREHKVNRSRRQMNSTKTECVYSSIK